jgi:tetratricopeptide (TPR) repeat protein
MVLIRFLILGLLSLWLVACSNVQKQRVIAANTGGGGQMASASERENYAPTPKAAFDLLRRAEQMADQGNWNGALRYLDQAQRMAPDEAKVYLTYGEIYIRQDRIEQAVAMFKRVLSLASANSAVARQARNYLSDIQSN